MNKNSKAIFIILAVVAAAILAGAYVDSALPAQTANTKDGTVSATASSSSEYGAAPEFKSGDTWLNGSAQTLAGLKGKVVLVDFWTYSCINCIRTLPHVTRWYDTYKDKGLVVVGVHTPEFAFEQDTANVKDAIGRFGIHYPVVQDNDYGIWNSFNNEYWPAEYLIDQNGNIVEEHFGEGDYDKTEDRIRELLGLQSLASGNAGEDLSQIASPEMYFGTDRIQNLSASQSPSSSPADYVLSADLALNEFSLGGKWQFSPKYAELASGSGKIRLKFRSGKIFLVASSKNPARLDVVVDGKRQQPVIVQDPKLYTLFSSEDYSEHVIEISVSEPGFEAFTFTFG